MDIWAEAAIKKSYSSTPKKYVETLGNVIATKKYGSSIIESYETLLFDKVGHLLGELLVDLKSEASKKHGGKLIAWLCTMDGRNVDWDKIALKC